MLCVHTPTPSVTSFEMTSEPHQLVGEVAHFVILKYSDPHASFDLHKTLMKTLYGQIKLATERCSGLVVAVKLSSKDLMVSKRTCRGVKVLEDPLEEQQILKLLANSPDQGPGSGNIVRLLAEAEDATHQWSIFEYAEKGELFAHVGEGGLDLFRSKTWFRQIALGTHYLHRNNIAHLDLSLENVLLDKYDNAKICDFGMARNLNNVHVSDASDRPGKICYMAPEILAGQPYDPKKADVFSLGVDLFLLLTGVLPFQLPAFSDPCFNCIAIGEIARLLDAWDLKEKVCQEAAHLISNMICAEQYRYSIDHVLAHPWLSNLTPPNSPSCKCQ